MRKVLLAFIIFCIGVSFVYSQDMFNKDDRVYVKTIPIFKILAHELGYKIFYTKGGTTISAFYIPYGWMAQAGGKGQVIWGDNAAYPYASIYYVNGKLDHVNLYLQENMGHYSWGILNKTVTEVKPFFDQDPEKFKIEF
jgi:hypothetical protein